jgi:hypothetical protein
LANLREVIDRLVQVLIPWGFQYEPREHGHGSAGAYANGQYGRGPTRIPLVWRANLGLGWVEYQHEEVLQRGYLRERITWGLGHGGYMQAIGHGDDCWLVEEENSSVARRGGDPVTALVHDLQEYAAPTLAAECPEFVALLQTGYRLRDVL